MFLPDSSSDCTGCGGNLSLWRSAVIYQRIAFIWRNDLQGHYVLPATPKDSVCCLLGPKWINDDYELLSLVIAAKALFWGGGGGVGSCRYKEGGKQPNNVIIGRLSTLFSLLISICTSTLGWGNNSQNNGQHEMCWAWGWENWGFKQIFSGKNISQNKQNVFSTWSCGSKNCGQSNKQWCL